MNYSVRNIVAAVGLAVVAIVLVTWYTQGYKHSVNSSQTKVTVYVAQRDIPAGTKAEDIVGAGLLVPRQVVVSDAAPGVVTATSQISGVAAEPIHQGEQVLVSTFQAPVTQEPKIVMKGLQRAIQITLDDDHAVAGTVHAGDHVDVLWYSLDGAGTQNVAIRMATNVLVLKAPNVGVGDPTSTGTNGPNHILLEAKTDKLANQLFWASEQADSKLLFLVRPERAKDSETALADWDTLLKSLPKRDQKTLRGLASDAKKTLKLG